jgi:hypothetical protein
MWLEVSPNELGYKITQFGERFGLIIPKNQFVAETKNKARAILKALAEE